MYSLLERYDILSHRISDSLHTAMNPITQKDAVQYLEAYKASHEASLTKNEMQEINNFISKNGEWAANGDATEHSKHPILKTIYAKKPDFFHQTGKDFSIIFNPIIYYRQSFESGNSKQNIFFNSKGIEARGNIGKRLGFYTMLTDNQERGPQHHQNYVITRNAVPGANYYKYPFKPKKPGFAQDYLYASGYLDASLLKEHVNVSFGQDRFHIGDGYRSLFLSDFGSNYLFLRVNTRIGRFNYQNLFMDLTSQYKQGGDRLLPRKYAAVHHLSINVSRWLNLGFFESVVFGRKDFFDLYYLNPIIFYRSVEQTKGSPDNSMLGMNFKINTTLNTVIYGQILLDEFKFGELKDGNGWWGNKYGMQLGLKVADPFGIKNLLIQPEFNVIRPFTYSYHDSVAEFSHYNQPLAHPYGANLMELSLNINYKPSPKIALSWRSFYNKQGRDTASNVSFGGNIFSSYNNRPTEYGVGMFSGFPSEVLFTNLNAAYEIRDNFYIDVSAGYRKERASHPSNPSFSSALFGVGFRLNASRKQYDY